MHRKNIITYLLILGLVVPAILTCCTRPLGVYIAEPMSGTVVNSAVTVKGTVSDAKATVWVNDIQVVVTRALKNGRFSTQVDFTGFDEGEYTITITAARGKDGKWKDVVAGKPIVIRYKPE